MVERAGLTTATLLALTTIGCETPDPDQLPADRDTFTETAVTLRADGPPLIEQRPLSLAQERQQNLARARLLAGELTEVFAFRDTACAASSFWLYNEPNQTGDRICFAGPGVVDLHDYSITIAVGGSVYRWYWDRIADGSYWPGNYAGFLDWPLDNAQVDANHGPSAWVAYGLPRSFMGSPVYAHFTP